MAEQMAETKANTKLVGSREPLLYPEFNKPNKPNVYEINSFINSTFLIVDTLIDNLTYPAFSLSIFCKNTSDILGYRIVCHFFVLFTF